MMIKRFKTFFAELEKRKIPQIPAQIDRSHFLDATDPMEASLTKALHGFPPGELGFLIMSFGLDSRNPKAPQVIAEAMDMMLLKVLDIGTGAELRLRNRTQTRSLIEGIAGQEVAGLARHLGLVATMRDEHRRRSATELWFYGRRPLRRLAISTALEGGFGAFVSLVREGRESRPGLGHADRVAKPARDLSTPV